MAAYPKSQITLCALARLDSHDWPGNVRELKNVADRWALGIADGLTADSISVATGTLSERVELVERKIIEDALRQCDGNVARCAEFLMTPKKTLYDKLTRHGLVAEHYRQIHLANIRL